MIMQSSATPERPWLGLAPFTEAERGYFSGRAPEIRELCDRVLRSPLTVLYGVSGHGKSSLLSAGLIPALRDEGMFPIRLPRFVFDDRSQPPLRQALAAVAAAFARDGGPLELDAASLWQCFHARSGPWGTSEAPSQGRPVLIFDQFEDMFTQGEDKGGANAEAAHGFLTDLADLVENRPPAALRERMRGDRELVRAYDFEHQPVNVVIALREDFVGRLERWRRVMPSVVENRLELRPLSGRQALRAILDPARKRPDKVAIVDDATAEALVRFIAGSSEDIPLDRIENVPPLLSLICARLNERRFSATDAVTPVRDDIPVEWVQGVTRDEALPESSPNRTAAEEVFEQFYRDALAAYPEAVQRFVEEELVADAGYRETVSLDTAVAKLSAAEVPHPRDTIDRLVDQRLLAVEERGGVSRLELTHDILCKPALRHRGERRERDALAAKEAAEAARREEERDRREADRLRDKAIASRRIAYLLAILAAAALAIASVQWKVAVDQRKIAIDQRAAADASALQAHTAAREAQDAVAQKERAIEEMESAFKQREEAFTAAESAKMDVDELLLQSKAYEFCAVLADTTTATAKDFFAPGVVYLGKRMPRADVLHQLANDQGTYGINFCTVTEKPSVSPETDGTSIVAFRFRYTLIAPDRVRRGRGTITLRVDQQGQVSEYAKNIVGGD
jgi:hypothetical protein